MRFYFFIILFFIIPFAGAAQDTVIEITPSDMSPNYKALGNVDGWLFRQGNDLSWSEKETDEAGWEKLSPSRLSDSLADKNGRLEGWFRIKIKIDSSFGNTALGFHMNSWAATDVYVDGNLLHSFGNTGADGKPFEEYIPTYKLPVDFNIEKGTEHTIAIHIVEYESPIPPFRLKSENRFKSFASITKPEFKASNYKFF
ncbi:MAG: hypothetical protein R3A12_16900, partial [Ignavibacteria bacterium]